LSGSVPAYDDAAGEVKNGAGNRHNVIRTWRN
jgi:hypothetical protein